MPPNTLIIDFQGSILKVIDTIHFSHYKFFYKPQSILILIHPDTINCLANNSSRYATLQIDKIYLFIYYYGDPLCVGVERIHTGHGRRK